MEDVRRHVVLFLSSPSVFIGDPCSRSRLKKSGDRFPIKTLGNDTYWNVKKARAALFLEAREEKNRELQKLEQN